MAVELSPFPHTELLHSGFDDRLQISLLCVATKTRDKASRRKYVFYTIFSYSTALLTEFPSNTASCVVHVVMSCVMIYRDLFYPQLYNTFGFQLEMLMIILFFFYNEPTNAHLL